MNHKILAPHHRAANALVSQLKSAGCDARHTLFGKYHVVLVRAPYSVLAKACQRAQFNAGLQEGYNAR